MPALDSECQRLFALKGCLKCDLVLRFSTPGSFMMQCVPAWPGYLGVGLLETLSNNLAIEYKLISQLRKTMNSDCTRGQTLKLSGGEQITLQLTGLLL